MAYSKKKILYVLQNLETGGAEQVRLTAEKYINKDRYDTTYCCIKTIGPIGEKMMANGGEVISLESKDNFYNLIATYKLYRLVKRLKPDLIHSVLFNANFHGRVAAMLTGTPVVSEEQGIYAWRKWYHIFLDKFLARFTYRIIASSQGIKDFIMTQEGIRPDKIAVVYNCVDPALMKSALTRPEARARLSVLDSDFVIGAVGNLRKEKGHGILLCAFQKVLERYKNARLFIAGSGPLGDELAEKAKSLKIDESTVFLGRTSDIAGFLKALDLFVMPSVSEGLPVALLEALASGIACVASDVGGMKEVARDLKGVKMVRPGDPDELADAIMSEVEKSSGRIPEARYVENRLKGVFTPEVYINRLDEIYKAALSKN